MRVYPNLSCLNPGFYYLYNLKLMALRLTMNGEALAVEMTFFENK